jgi:hypothetical protein
MQENCKIINSVLTHFAQFSSEVSDLYHSIEINIIQRWICNIKYGFRFAGLIDSNQSNKICAKIYCPCDRPMLVSFPLLSCHVIYNCVIIIWSSFIHCSLIWTRWNCVTCFYVSLVLCCIVWENTFTRLHSKQSTIKKACICAYWYEIYVYSSVL